MLDKKIKECPKCGKLKLVRLIGAGTGIIFKGTGFYETDYKRTSAPSTGSSGSSPSGSKSTGSNSDHSVPKPAKSESKPGTKDLKDTEIV